MNYKHKLLFIFLLFSEVIFCQKCFSIFDNVSKSKIAYANIWRDNKIFMNSDSLGSFCINESEIKSKFEISCFGYKSQYLNIERDSIFLDIDEIIIEEVVIKKPLLKNKIKYGNYKIRNAGLVATYEMQIAELGKVFLTNDSIQRYFNKLKIATFASNSNRIVGVKIYSLDDNKQPNIVITDKIIISNIKKGSHITSIDLSNLSLSVPKTGFFISIQFLLLEQNKQHGTYNKEWFYYEPSIGANMNSKGNEYFYLSENGSWKKNENCDLNIQVELTN